ncbi:hypothetical protein BDZ90DRAFT_275597 [Jaminaea rosea]|uniref:Uncharacterized protein n=1 Tax=Jaminaea rosea TaxID=1569628 RepID=A0A316ULE5_9BASI|nr:hypothetical protein BDZ90DRAFT_275597 [Jaminaea rosea]PWN26112.1 hypothetical protein BDZ90DRAFT_275597 [Jaminaea rosea]
MSTQHATLEHSPDPSPSAFPSTRASTSRSGSVASIWSSAEIPFFLDARRRSSEVNAARKGSTSAASGSRSASASGSASGSGSGSGSAWSHGPRVVALASSRNNDYDFPGRRRSVRDVPDGPSSPRPSVDSLASWRRGSNSGSDGQGRRTSSLALPDAAVVPTRGFQTRKPATLAIHPIAYTSPLATHNERDASPTTTTSTQAPSLATSPVPSSETDASASCSTPLTAKSINSSMHPRDVPAKPLPSLYARAGQFFRADYTMVSPLTANADEIDPLDASASSAIPIPAAPPRVTMLAPVTEAGMGPRSPRSLLRPHTAAATTGSFLEAPFSREQHRRALAKQRHQSLAPWQLAQLPSPLESPHSGDTITMEQEAAMERQRTMSVPKLSALPHPLSSSRKSSWGGQPSPPATARQDSDDEGAGGGSSNATPYRAPTSPRSFRSGILRRSGRPSSSRLNTPTSVSTAPGTLRPKSSSGKGAGWSSYLSEGLTLYIDQGPKRDFAIKVPYLRYDPFGRPEDIADTTAAAASGTPDSKPGTPRKSKGRLSAIDPDDEVGTLEFGHLPQANDAEAVLFSRRGSAPILRHLGIGDDTKADLLTRQAALSLDANGLHEVSGYERHGKIAWRFKYQVMNLGDGEAALRPVSFDCSATLLDPTRARKARLFKMVKKGVTSTLASSLVASESGSRGSHSGESDGSSPRGQRTRRGDLRRPSEWTNGSSISATSMLRQSTSNTVSPPPSTGSLSPVSRRVEYQPRNGSLGYARSTKSTRLANVLQAERLLRASQGDLASSSRSSSVSFGAGGSGAESPLVATRAASIVAEMKPTTPSEEIKRAYLMRAIERDEHQHQHQHQHQPRVSPPATRSPASARFPPTAAREEPSTTPTQEHFFFARNSPTGGVSTSSRSSGGSSWAEHFASLAASSQRRLRQAVSSKALPELPPASSLPLLRKKKSSARTISGGGSGAVGGGGEQAGSGAKPPPPPPQSSLLSELGFI